MQEDKRSADAEAPPPTQQSPLSTARTPARVLAENVKAYRLLRKLTQEQLAERMVALEHPWNGGIVSFLERRDRGVNTDELVGLALCLGVSIGQLLDPGGPTHDQRGPLAAFGANTPKPWTMSAEDGELFMASRIYFEVFDAESLETRPHHRVAPELSLAARRRFEAVERQEAAERESGD